MVVPTRLIEAAVEAPPMVEVRKRKGKVRIAVRLELRNVSEADYVVHAPDRDQEVFWHVLNERHEELLREQPRKKMRRRAGMESFRSRTISTTHSEHETEMLVIEASTLEDGHTYTVRAEFFGQICEDEFVVFFAPEEEPAPKKLAKRKPTKRRLVRKKATQKKATRKRAARRGAAKKR